MNAKAFFKKRPHSLGDKARKPRPNKRLRQSTQNFTMGHQDCLDVEFLPFVKGQKMRNQAGFLMIEAMLALTIAAVVLMAITPNRRLNNDTRGSVAVADAFDRADVVAAAWAAKHIGGMMTTGPTVVDVDAATLAPDVGVTGYDASSLPRGVKLRFRASLAPAGCLGVQCSVEWLLYSTGGTGFTPGQAAGIVRALGARGAASTPENPSVLLAWRNRWTIANPQGAAPNTVGARGAYAQTAVAQSIRVDGTSELVANWNVDNDAKGVDAALGNALSLGEAVAATDGGACTIANATALAADGVTTLACVGDTWVITHTPTQTVVGTTTTVSE